MLDHDRLFKELLSTFLREFLELFAPELAAAVEPGPPDFLDKETFTEKPIGELHVVDLLARVRLRPEALAADPGVRAASSRTSPGDAEPEIYDLRLPGLHVLRFRFRAIQLNRIVWRAFLQRRSAIAAALMARTRMEHGERPDVKYESLRMLAS